MIAILSVLLFTFTVQVQADRGVLPILDVDVYGPGQKAIVAWNGEFEHLTLSTDLYSSLETKILELIPLPSEPNVERVDFKVFESIQRLILAKMPRALSPSYKGGLEIIFHEKIGPHEITVIKATEIDGLTRFIIDYTSKIGLPNPPSMTEKTKMILMDYLMRGFKYWVLDLVEISPMSRSIEPITYTFNSPTLYYPMKISATAKGSTEVTLYLITREPPNESDLPPKMRFARYLPSSQTVQFRVSTEDLASIDPKIRRLFDGEAWFTAVKYEGDVKDMDFDVEVPRRLEKCRTISVGTGRDEYLVGETIKVKVDFTHLNPGCVEVAVIHFHQIRLEIFNPAGESIRTWRWSTEGDLHKTVALTASEAGDYIVKAGSYWNGERLEVEDQTHIRVLRSGLYAPNEVRWISWIVPAATIIIAVALTLQILQPSRLEK